MEVTLQKSNPSKAYIQIYGSILKDLIELCGKETKLKFDFNLERVMQSNDAGQWSNLATYNKELKDLGNRNS